MNQIGKLSSVAIRAVWPDEAADFTPWLANNADRFGEALGMDLDHEQTEAAVGQYSADLVFRDVSSGRLVVVENMLGTTDHDHLGSVRPKTGDLAVARRRRRVFSWRILRPVGIFSKKSSPSRAKKAASGDVGALRATPKRPTSRVGYQNRNRPRLRGHQTSSTASTRLASQTLSFLTLQ